MVPQKIWNITPRIQTQIPPWISARFRIVIWHKIWLSWQRKVFTKKTFCSILWAWQKRSPMNTANTGAIIADFSQSSGTVNKMLHCSNYMPCISHQNILNFNDAYEKMHFTAARTHDQALTNAGQRLVDTHFIFLLFSIISSISIKGWDNFCFLFIQLFFGFLNFFF